MSRRSSERIHSLDSNEPLTKFDYAIEFVLAVALIYSPLAYGATLSFGQEVLYGLIGLAAILVGAKWILIRGTRFVFTWAYVPMVLYLALVVLSVIPLPAGVVQTISPGTFEEKSRLMADIPNVRDLLSKLTISFNVRSTLHGLRLILAASTLFVVVINIYQTPAQIKRLLATVAVAGLLVTLLTLAQNVSQVPGQPHRIYWNIPVISMDAIHQYAGPFVGKAQLGQYLNLTIGAMIGLAMMFVAESFQNEEITVNEILEKLGSNRLRLAMLLILCSVVAAGAIAWSMSRGAMLGLGIAGLLAGVLFLVKRGWRKSESVLLINCLIIIAVGMGIGYVLFDAKFGKLVASTSTSGASRKMILQSMKPMYHQWPVMGTGVESFEWVFPLFQPKEETAFYVYAENEYAQTISDTGIVGGLIVLSFVAVMIYHWAGAFRGRRPLHLATVGIGLGLIAIIIHSFSDFSQHIPAVAMVTSVLLGLTVSLHRIARSDAATETKAIPSFNWSPLPRLVPAMLMVAAMAWSVVSLDYLRRAEAIVYESYLSVSSFFKTPITDPQFQVALDDYYDPAITDNAEACRLDPMNVLYKHWLNHFRWRKLIAKRDPKTDAIEYPADARQVAERIVEEMSAARNICPAYGRLYTLLGAVQWEFFDKDEAVKNLEIGRRRSTNDPESLYYLARIAGIQGRWDDAELLARHCCKIDHSFAEPLSAFFSRGLHRPDMAVRIFNDDSGVLWQLTNQLSDQPELLKQIRSRLLELAEKKVLEEPNNAGAWAFLAMWTSELGDHSRTIDAYRKSVELDYGNVGVRLKFARFLQKVGRKDDAIQEVEIVLRIQPQQEEAKALLKELTALAPLPAKP